jgi:protein TonB
LLTEEAPRLSMTSIADSPTSAPLGQGTGGDARAMMLALSLAAAAHALLLLGIGFELPVVRAPDAGVIEVMLIKQSGGDQPPPDAVAAQADRAAETSTPLPELDEPEPDSPLESTQESADNDRLDIGKPSQSAVVTEPIPMAPPEPSVAERELLSEPKLEPVPESIPKPESVPERLEVPVPETEPGPPEVITSDASPQALELPPAVSAADILASRNAEIAQLTARINAQTSAYASRARRKAISTSTREYRYASYMEAWRRKVERIGNLNYPEEAARRGLYGALILHVAVRVDGTLEGIRVVRSSGQEVLDQAAVRIVELAAPFAPFPPDIAAETDVLDITRTWQFQRNNRLGWDQ